MIQAQIAAAINRHAINTSIVGTSIQYCMTPHYFLKSNLITNTLLFFIKRILVIILKPMLLPMMMLGIILLPFNVPILQT